MDRSGQNFVELLRELRDGLVDCELDKELVDVADKANEPERASRDRRDGPAETFEESDEHKDP